MTTVAGERFADAACNILQLQYELHESRKTTERSREATHRCRQHLSHLGVDWADHGSFDDKEKTK